MEAKLDGIGKRLDQRLDEVAENVGVVAELQKVQVQALQALADDFDSLSKDVREYLESETEEEDEEKKDEQMEDAEDETMRE